jgi:arylsulfatase A-like enzyme
MNAPRSLFRAATLLVAGLLPGLSACGASQETQPNVVLVSIDTLRPDFLGCYGHERDTSPAIDAFARAGTIFADVTAASPWTLPSHATMLTGQYPSTHGVKSWEFALTTETLATWFKRAGYQTMAVVNSANIGVEDYGLMRGYEKPDKHWELETEILATGKPGRRILNKGTQITKRAIQYMKDRDPARPFFLFVHYYDVHTDFTPDAKYEREFVRPYSGRASWQTSELIKLRKQKVPLDDLDVRYLEEMYEAEIRTFDDKLARLFEYLDSSGLAQTTVVAITSDHGEEYFEHGGLLHGFTMYQELLRIPLILRGPGVPPGNVVEMPAHLIDVAPTLFQLAGVSAPPRMDGLDLALAWKDPSAVSEPRFLFGEADESRRVKHHEVFDIKRMVRLGDTKLLFDRMTGAVELYDLGADPGEKNDIHEQEPERTALLLGQLERFMERQGSAQEIGPLDEDTRKLLESLGYVEGVETEDPGEDKGGGD